MIKPENVTFYGDEKEKGATARVLIGSTLHNGGFKEGVSSINEGPNILLIDVLIEDARLIDEAVSNPECLEDIDVRRALRRSIEQTDTPRKYELNRSRRAYIASRIMDSKRFRLAIITTPVVEETILYRGVRAVRQATEVGI